MPSLGARTLLSACTRYSTLRSTWIANEGRGMRILRDITRVREDSLAICEIF